MRSIQNNRFFLLLAFQQGEVAGKDGNLDISAVADSVYSKSQDNPNVNLTYDMIYSEVGKGMLYGSAKT